MIKAGIIGGSNPMAGELLRLLVNHPDVEIIWVNSARYAGRLLSDVHHGLLGESELRIIPTADLDTINVLFIFRHKGQTIEWLRDRAIPKDLRIIDLSVDMQAPQIAADHGFVYGLPELNRKVMVRGAMRAIVPHPVAAAASLALLPLAKEEMLKGDVEVLADTPQEGEKLELSPSEIAAEVAHAIRELQPTFAKGITISERADTHPRALTARVTTPTELDVASLTRLYEEFYDDHNFVFVTAADYLDPKEVEGTNKCLIHIAKAQGEAQVTVMMDTLIKGAAGTAVHDMNLLFGLHERTGLALKACRY